MPIVVRLLLAQSALAVATLAGASLNSAHAAWEEKVRYHFVQEEDDDASGIGSAPRLGVLKVGSTLYGVTSTGGNRDGGVAYRHFKNNNGDRKTKPLYSFNDGSHGSESCGYQPSSPLIKDPSKLVLYGTTYYGGNRSTENEDGSEYDGGVVFSLTPTDENDLNEPWDCKAIHSFSKKGSSGYAPFGGLIFGSDGMLYGTTQYNAVKTTAGIKSPTGGVVFRIATDGSSYEVLHSFTHSTRSKGLIPAGPVVEAADGFLYGATFFGGSGNAGAIYKLTKTGASFAVIHSFGKGSKSAKSGYQPTQGPLLIDGNDIYGATTLGGCEIDSDDDPQCTNKDSLPGGVLFTLKTSGSGYKVLHRFDSGKPGIEEGYSPYGGLVMDDSGWLYGVAQLGGPENSGVAFRFKSSKYSVLAGFGDELGMTPSGPLTLDSGRNLYGVTSAGGEHEGGVLYFIDKP